MTFRAKAQRQQERLLTAPNHVEPCDPVATGVLATQIPLAEIRTDPQQCRSSFDADNLEGLRRSLERVGQLHPVLVRPTATGDGYRLIAGERRVRAAALAGWSTIAAVVLPAGTEDRDPEVQLIENLQREDLNPVDKARAAQRFMTEHHLTKVEAADRLGIPRTTLTDWLNCLDVEPYFQQAVIHNFENGSSPITPSHVSIAVGLARKLLRPELTRELLAVSDQMQLSKLELRQVAAIMESDRQASASDAAERVRARAASRRRAAQRERAAAPAATADRVVTLVRAAGRESAQLRGTLAELSRYASLAAAAAQTAATDSEGAGGELAVGWRQLPEQLLDTYELLARVLRDVFGVDAIQTAQERYLERRRAARKARHQVMATSGEQAGAGRSDD